MCYAASCNPTCGKCRPKRIIQASCPVCGKTEEMTREEYLLFFNLPHRRNVMDRKIIEEGGPSTPRCAMCGADMTALFKEAVKPLPCRKSRVVCGYPCGGCNEPYREGAMPCAQMVPLEMIAE
jgi:hypothetical protein